MSGHVIMYIGLQLADSYDRPNNDMSRVWRGPGDVVGEVPSIAAQKLCVHEDEWEDVTAMSEPQRDAYAKKIRARAETKRREMMNPVGVSQGRNVDALSTDELEAELARRKALEKDANSAAPTPTKGKSKAKAVDKPKDDVKLNELILAAVETVMHKAKDDESLAAELLDDDKVPTLAAVQEETGIPLTEEDRKSVV